MKKISILKYSALAFALLYGGFFPHQTVAAKKAPELAFYPAKDWTVSEGASCTVANEFNNGFIIQLDGTGNGVQVMTVNLRQDALDTSKKYRTNLSVPGYSRVAASSNAQNAQILTLNLKGQDRLYREMRDAGVFDLKIDDNEFRFYTAGFSAIAKDFEACMAAKKSPPPAAVTTLDSAPNNEIVVSSNKDIHWNDESPIDIVPPSTTHEVRGNDKTGLSHIGIEPDSPVKIERETTKITADFRGIEDKQARLELENQQLRDELRAALEESRKEEISIKGSNWDLEQATLMYNESERQVQLLGQKLKRTKTSCDLETKELEAMLFDPQVTNEQQLAKLADLEGQLGDAQTELERQRIRYDERIRVLERQLQTQ